MKVISQIYTFAFKKWALALGIILLLLQIMVTPTCQAQSHAPEIVAHRGAWIKDQIPQNSIASLKQAVLYACHGTELDVHITADEVLVVNHDADFQGIPINTSTWKQLQSKTLTNGEPLPLLKDYLSEGLKTTDLTLYVEIKTAAAGPATTLKTVEKTLQLIRDLKAEDRVVYILFNLQAAEYLMQLDPHAQVAYLNGDLSPAEAKAKGFAGLDYHYSVFQKNPHWIKEAKDLGLSLNAWTVNDPLVMEWLITHQFDYITTDFPLLVKESIPKGKSSQPFQVATYNLRLDVESDGINRWANRKDRVIQLIRYHAFDVFGTQEGFKHQLDGIKEGLPDFDYVGVGRDDGAEKGEYAAIFYNTSLFAPGQSGTFWLSTETDKPNKGWDAALPRICTWITLTHKESQQSFLVMNIHFDHVGVVARAESAKLLLEKAKTMFPALPLIVMGDFNVDQHNESYILLHQSGVVADAFHQAAFKYAPSGTFTGFDVKKSDDLRIDHIFVSQHFEVKTYAILTDTYGGGFLPSDHYPVVIKVEFKQ